MKRFFAYACLALATGSLAAWFFIPKTTQHGLDIWALDVGQGESILVREPSGKYLLFDGGPTDEVLSELGRVLPIWQRTLNVVVLSHPHSDHIRGLISVLKRYTVEEVWSSGSISSTSDFTAWKTTLKEHQIPTRTTKAGMDLPFGATNIHVYYPIKTMEGVEPKNAHEGDTVLKISYGQGSILLTGDLNEEHEHELTQYCQLPLCTLAASVLQIPHHGSASGLTPDFLKAVNPLLSVIPVGLGNTFHHPRPEIIHKLEEAHIPILRTDTDHRVHMAIQQKILSAETESGKHYTITLPALSVPP
jgi:competence protein ComEC